MFGSDTQSALWLSHSSLSEYLKCPRAYFLHNVFRDPKTHHKLALLSPHLTLGQVVHDVLDDLSKLPTTKRLSLSLRSRFETRWAPFHGLKGGFVSASDEAVFFNRGLNIMANLHDHPGPLIKLAVKIKTDLPWYWLSETDKFILCGRIDWLEYLPESRSVHIIDFKTSQQPEAATSLQLPIYALLATHCQTRPVVQTSYWYIERDESPTPSPVPDPQVTTATLMKIAKDLSLKRKLDRLICPHQGCRHCRPFETILEGGARFLYTNSRNQDLYLLPQTSTEVTSEIL